MTRVTPYGKSISISRSNPQPGSDATLPLGETALSAITTATSPIVSECVSPPTDTGPSTTASMKSIPLERRPSAAALLTWKVIGKVALIAKSIHPPENVIDIYHDPSTNVSKYMIHPNSQFRRLWDLFTTVFVMYVCIMVPLTIGFNYIDYGELKTFDQLVDVYFIFDMIITMRTGIFSNGEVIMDSKVVMSRYLRTWFIIDAISNFPLSLFVSSTARKSIKMVKLQKLPKLLRFGRVLKYLREYAKYYNLVLSFIAMFMGLHCFACVWVFLFSECYDLKGNVICDNEEMPRMYMQSLQTIMLMFLGIAETSSYGSISRLADPRGNNVDIEFYLMNVIVSLTGLIFTSVLFGNILSLLMSWDQQKAQFRNRMDIIAAEMRYYELPEELQHRVRRNYDYLWINQRAYSDMMLLNQPGISKTLRMTIALHLYKDLVKTVPFFAGSDVRFLGKVCLALETAVYLPGDTIIYYDDIGKEMFIVRKGLVEIILPNQDKTDKRIYLRDGNFFGETALVIDVRRTNTVRAVNICDLNVLSKTSFNEIAAEYPEFGERMKRTVIKRQLDNMNIQSPDEKIKVQNQLTKVVEKSLKARRMSVSLRAIYRAKKLGDKLKEITDRPKNKNRLKSIPKMAPILTFDPSGRIASQSDGLGDLRVRSFSLPLLETTDEEVVLKPMIKNVPCKPLTPLKTTSPTRPFATMVTTTPLAIAPTGTSKIISDDTLVPNALHEINAMVNAIKKATDRLNRRLQQYDDVSSDDEELGSMADEEHPPRIVLPDESEQEMARRERRSVFVAEADEELAAEYLEPDKSKTASRKASRKGSRKLTFM